MLSSIENMPNELKEYCKIYTLRYLFQIPELLNILLTHPSLDFDFQLHNLDIVLKNQRMYFAGYDVNNEDLWRSDILLANIVEDEVLTEILRLLLENKIITLYHVHVCETSPMSVLLLQYAHFVTWDNDEYPSTTVNIMKKCITNDTSLQLLKEIKTMSKATSWDFTVGLDLVSQYSIFKDFIEWLSKQKGLRYTLVIHLGIKFQYSEYNNFINMLFTVEEAQKAVRENKLEAEFETSLYVVFSTEAPKNNSMIQLLLWKLKGIGIDNINRLKVEENASFPQDLSWINYMTRLKSLDFSGNFLMNLNLKTMNQLSRLCFKKSSPRLRTVLLNLPPNLKVLEIHCNDARKDKLELEKVALPHSTTDLIIHNYNNESEIRYIDLSDNPSIRNLLFIGGFDYRSFELPISLRVLRVPSGSTMNDKFESQCTSVHGSSMIVFPKQTTSSPSVSLGSLGRYHVPIKLVPVYRNPNRYY